MNAGPIKEQLVSVGILCFNARNTIIRAIKGALEQDWKKLEVLVVDDFSSDDSVEIIKKSNFFSNINLIENKKNMGPAFSRNLIISYAKGEFICFMDDDDFSDPKRVSLQIESVLRSGYPKEKHIISTCGIKRKYSSGYVSLMHPMGFNGMLPKSNELADYLLFFERRKGVDYGFASPTCAMFLTSSCFEKVGIFDPNLRRVEDMDITIRFSLENLKFTSAKEFLVYQQSSYGTDKTPEVNLKSEIQMIKKYKNYLSKKGMYMYSILWPNLRYHHFKKNYLKLTIYLFFIFIRYPLRTFKHFLHSTIKRIAHEYKIKNFRA